jgi:hypothetical protein
MHCRVKWNDAFSSWFYVPAGTKQGGVLSPLFYSLYVDDLVVHLQHCGFGCYVRDVFLSCLLYADDMGIVSPSIKALRRLLNIVSEYCGQWDIKLNPKKSKLMFFGRNIGPLAPVYMNGVALKWEETWPYLGVDVKSGLCFSCNPKSKLAKFYKSVNCILRIGGIQIELLNSILILTYTRWTNVRNFPCHTAEIGKIF